MSEITLTFTAIVSVVAGTLRRALPPSMRDDALDERGAVSIEHVLWYAAAAISVAVVATIIWNQVKATASTPIQSPSAP